MQTMAARLHFNNRLEGFLIIHYPLSCNVLGKVISCDFDGGVVNDLLGAVEKAGKRGVTLGAGARGK